MRFALIFRFSCGPRSIVLAGKRNTSGERYTSGRRDLLRTSSRSNATRNVTSTSNVLVKKRFTTGARRCLECEKIHDVDEQVVYRTCTVGGRSDMVPIHVRYTIVYRTWFGIIHVQCTMVLPGWIGNQGDVVEGGRSAEALVWE